MNNDRMKPGRFLQWHRARQRVARIQNHLRAGGVVLIGNPLRVTRFTRRHADLFKATQGGAFYKSGKSWLCFDSGLEFPGSGIVLQ